MSIWRISAKRRKFIEILLFPWKRGEPPVIQAHAEIHRDQLRDKVFEESIYCGDCGAWIKTGVSDIDKGVMEMDKYHLMKYISKAAGQMLDDTNEVKGRLWKALYKGKKKKFVKTLKAMRKSVPNEKAVNECEEYVLNNWDRAVLRMQDKNVYGCSAEGHVSHVYSDRMSSRPIVWSEIGADAMCQLRCYVRDYGEEKIIDLVHYRRKHKQLEVTGTDCKEPKYETDVSYTDLCSIASTACDMHAEESLNGDFLRSYCMASMTATGFILKNCRQLYLVRNQKEAGNRGEIK